MYFDEIRVWRHRGWEGGEWASCKNDFRGDSVSSYLRAKHLWCIRRFNSLNSVKLLIVYVERKESPNDQNTPSNQGVRERGRKREMKIKLHKNRKFIFVEMFSEENRCWSDLFVRLGFLFVLLCFVFTPQMPKTNLCLSTVNGTLKFQSIFP